MVKKRVYELAKEMNIESKRIVDAANKVGIDVKNHMGSLSQDDEKKLRQIIGGARIQNNGNSSKQNSEKKEINNLQDEQADKKVMRGQRVQISQQRAHQQRGGQQPRPNQSAEQKSNKSNQGSKAGNGTQERPNKPTQHNAGNQSNKGTAASAKQHRPTGTNQNNQQAKTGSQSPRSNADRTNRPQSNRPANTGSQQGQRQNNNQANGNRRPNSEQRPDQRSSQTRPANQQQRSNQTNRKPAQAATKPAAAASNTPAAKEQDRNGQNQNKKRKNQYSQNFNRNNNQNRNRNRKGKKGRQQEVKKPAVPPRKFRELPEVLVYSEGMTVADLSKRLHREPAEIIKKLFMMGVMATLNQSLDKEAIELLAADYGIEAEEKIQVDVADIDKFFEVDAMDPEKMVSRPPVVTIMGHVDHGKTTLLDTLRNTKVSLGEAGGITQHIGAYQLEVEGKPITFLDTPGHAAFTSMRARGAKITDITILVVAADDGVMPQTVEAINHSKAAEVPIIVAVNKIDKPGANPDRVMQELSEYGLVPEAWGGDTIFVQISAKFGQNLEELLEMILLVAEVQELKADPTFRPIGSVIEARLDKGKGPITTLLVQEGTLKVGDPIVVGNTFGRVRVMTNDIGRRVKTAGPATPVEITGLNDVPQAGDRFVVYDDEKTARQAGEERANRALLEHRAASSRVTLDNLFESLKEGQLKQVDVIIKADVQGSAEALAASLNKIEVEGVRVNIIHTAVGAINESDVTLAAASNAIIIGFNVRPTPQAKIQAEAEKVDIRLHRIIYNVIDEIETAMKGMLDPEYEEKITGQMVVRELYKVSKVGTIAGCYVTEGYIQRDSGVRVIRDGIVIYEGELASLKRFKDDVKEVRLGFECGAMIENFNDVKVDDAIEGYVMEEIKSN